MKEFSKFYLPTQCFNDVCRVCLSKHNVLVPMKEINLTHNLQPNGSVENINLRDVFQKFCKVEVDVSDNKPQKICEFCINMGCKAFNFFQLFLYSNALLDTKLKEYNLSQEKPKQNVNNQKNSMVPQTQRVPDSVLLSQDETATINSTGASKDTGDDIENIISNLPVLAKSTQNKGDAENKKKRKYAYTSWSKNSPRKRFVYNTNIFSGIDPAKADALRVLLKIKSRICPRGSQSHTQQEKSGRGRQKSVKKPKSLPRFIQLRELEYHNDIFKCRNCPKIFHSIIKVIEHLKDKHADVKQCILCGTKVITLKSRIYHVAAHSLKALVCRICHLYFENQNDLDNHKNDVDHKNMKKCPKCQKIFKAPSAVKSHLKKVHIKRQDHQCELCGKMFRYHANMKRHERAAHGNEKGFLCQVCGRGFNALYNLKLHEQKLHNINQGESITAFLEKKTVGSEQTSTGRASRNPKKGPKIIKFECKLCPKKFFSKHLFFIHSESHPEFKDYRCDVCSEVFKTRKEYLDHYKIHEKFPCQFPTCAKMFVSKHKALLHKYTHRKPFRCGICDLSFRIRQEKAVHMNVHTGERPFVCDKCGRGFKQHGHLQVHLISHHGGKKPWQCRLCDKAFNFSHGLRCHMRSHTGEKPFPCPFCKRMFRDTSGRHKHVKKDHPKKMAEFLIYKKKYQDEEILKVDCESGKTNGIKTNSEDKGDDSEVDD